MFWLAPWFTQQRAAFASERRDFVERIPEGMIFPVAMALFVFDPGRFSHTVDGLGGPDPGKFAVALELYLADFP
jgi:hypothetical protein